MRPVRKEEIQRKILHIFSGTLIPAGIFYIPLWVPSWSWWPKAIPALWSAVVILAAITIGFFGVELLRLKHSGLSKFFHGAFGSMLRHEEKVKFTGATWIFLASVICSVIFVQHTYISVIVLSTFIWGDAVAALVGQSMGRIRVGKKSIEGSAACFILCLLSYFLVFPNTPGLLDAWGGKIPLLLTIAGSLCVTIMELFPIKLGKLELNDNLTVPVATGILLLGLHRFFC